MRGTSLWMAVASTAVIATFAWAPGVGAQDRDWCERSWGDRDAVCEERESRVPHGDGRLVIDGGQNGGVSVVGSSRSDVLVLARVWARARSEARAEELLDEIHVRSERGRIWADGPSNGRREGWGVSFDIEVPFGTDLDVETHNGGVSITDVEGSIEFRAQNGGVSLEDLRGDVRGHTQNGGLRVRLSGDRWSGAGLDVSTQNGGVVLYVPEEYSADLETGTVNGRLEFDIPITVRGRIDRRIRTQLGAGGPLVRVVTTNGGVHIRRN